MLPLVVSSFGTDDQLVKTLKSHENDLLKTESFKKSKRPLFQFVKKNGPNLGNMLPVLKSLALGQKSGPTNPYHAKNCKCCPLIMIDPLSEINGHPATSAPGTCKTKKVIYLAVCKLCSKPYTGRTVQMIGKRMNGHRECFMNYYGMEIILMKQRMTIPWGSPNLTQDHGLSSPEDFNMHYAVCILDVCSPSMLEEKEHNYIHRYNTLHPTPYFR